ncbi:hypothetical protein FQN53_001955 [Emmonsiellopsis sp. PD_33]|nr:hypothetical protein FQN53_001955 [Emmonsiellopsis sp. PD_33]
MSRNRRAVFGDPPSPYLAAVIERNRRAREARERFRRANEEARSDEELPRKKPRRPAAPSSANYHRLCTPPRRDPLVWMGPRSSRVVGGYAVSGSGVSNFGDSESNGGTQSEGDDSSSLYDTGGTSEESDGDDQNGDDGGHDGESQGGQDEGGSGVEGDQDDASDYRKDDEDDSSMVDDGDENTAIHGNSLHSDQATARTRHELEGGSGRNHTPVNHDSPILMNKTLCSPSLMDIDNEDFTSSNPYPISNQHFHQSLHKQGCYPAFPAYRRSTHRPFSVPGTIFIDPIDFDDDDLRTEAQEYLRWAAAAFQRPEHIENSSSDQNIPPLAQEALPQPASIRRPLDINRYNPIAQPRRGSQTGGVSRHMYQYQPEGIADPHSAVIGVGNRTGSFRDYIAGGYRGEASSGQDDQEDLSW